MFQNDDNQFVNMSQAYTKKKINQREKHLTSTNYSDLSFVRYVAGNHSTRSAF